MRLIVLLSAAGLLAACGEEVTPEEQERLDRQAIAEVEASQIPPPDTIDPQMLRSADFERHDMYGIGCSFTPASGGEDPIAVTSPSAGFMRIDDAVERFAPDAGSAESAFGTRVKYDGPRHSMRIELEDGDGEQVGVETIEHAARLTLRDGRDRLLYEVEGTAACGS